MFRASNSKVMGGVHHDTPIHAQVIHMLDLLDSVGTISTLDESRCTGWLAIETSNGRTMCSYATPVASTGS